jgi:BirA family transcriptional regulator, biotin operon repressor / biotin---[acetyl-CoA-carboxylase] ligase
MTTTHDLERALAAAGIEAPARWEEVTGSTNAVALDLAADGAPGWTVVAAGRQRQGRGRLGRTWHAEPGDALLFSLVLRPDLEPSRAGLLPLLAGAAMAEAAADVSGAPVRCKWPNDLLVGRAKAGGILAESDLLDGVLRHVVIGIGVNLRVPPDVPDAGALSGDVEPLDLLTRFLSGFRAAYRPGDDGFAPAVIERWSGVSATLGREVTATRSDGVTVHGRATALDERGGLVLSTTDGPATVAFGEILHLR